MAAKKTVTKKSTRKNSPRAKKKTAAKTAKKKPTAKKSRTIIAASVPTSRLIGKSVPNLTLLSTDGQSLSLSSLKGKNVVLYFYPKDSTPGCTVEGRDFRDRHAQFQKHNTVILGISRDSMTSHQRFREKEKFNFHLLSDADERACQAFDVIKMKNMYGKMVRGIERSTFLIDQQGIVRQEWRKVKVDGHADAVLSAVKSL